VRIVDQNKRVRFVPVKIIGDGPDGVWITGLPKQATIITVGQDYVSEGELVNAVPEGQPGQQT
jgi:multidrug efflux system membrane fusion protein